MQVGNYIGDVILALILVFPLFLGLFFKTSTSHIFFSLMAGELLGRYFGHDAELVVSAATKGAETTGYGEIGLIIVPMILTALFMKKTIVKGRVWLHIIPLAVTGVIFGAFVLPLLPAHLQELVQSSTPGAWILHLNKLIIGVMVALQLVSLWLFNRKEHGGKEPKHA